jgi:hypothetical protein
MFFVHYLKILRAMLAIKLLNYISHPDHIALLTYGKFIIKSGDIVVASHGDRLHEIEVGVVERVFDHGGMIYLRFYRRPK